MTPAPLTPCAPTPLTPERIYIETERDEYGIDRWADEPTPGLIEVEYVRADLFEALQTELKAAKEEIELDDKLLADRNRLLEAIPECPVHGACVPHALEWIEKAKALQVELPRPDSHRDAWPESKGDK